MIQLIIKIPSKLNKIIIGIVLLVVVILSIPSILRCVAYSHTPEHVVIKNDVKIILLEVNNYDYMRIMGRVDLIPLQVNMITLIP